MSTFQLLAAVSAAEGRATQAQIARNLGISAAALSEAVQVQVEKGYLFQASTKRDRRARLLQLTAPGQQKMDQVKQVVSKLEAQIEAGIAQADLESTARTMDNMIANLERLITESLNSPE